MTSVLKSNAFGHGIVIAVPDTAHGGVDAGIGQPFGVADGQVLAAAIGMMSGRRPRPGICALPTLGVCHVDHPHPGRYIGEVRYPELVGGIGRELTVDLVIWAGLRRIGDRCLLLAARNPLQSFLSHQPFGNG